MMLSRLSARFVAICLAVAVIGQQGTTLGQTRGQEGAALGGLAGAVLGGIAGHQNDETPAGIAIGGAVGAIAGGLLGKSRQQAEFRDYQYQQQAQQQYQQRIGRAISMQDVISLSSSGVSPALVMNQIRDNGVTHRLAVKDIIRLHQNGVPEVVINAMQEGRLASSPNAVPANIPMVAHRETIVVRPALPVGMIHIYGGHGPSHHGYHHYGHYGHHGFHH